VSGKTKFGGSTITQQLAKNLFLSGERSWERKFKELAYALLMEHELGKDRILELYLNYAQWGKDIFGCQEACLTYYKKSCSKLSVDQAINLAAMLASPGKHHPNMRESQFMAKRRAVIYQNMFPKKDSLLVDSLRQLMAPRSSSSQALDATAPVNAHDKPAKVGIRPQRSLRHPRTRLRKKSPLPRTLPPKRPRTRKVITSRTRGRFRPCR
jgi:Membrane carboxypeptidase (penicillin-binding protein)